MLRRGELKQEELKQRELDQGRQEQDELERVELEQGMLNRMAWNRPRLSLHEHTHATPSVGRQLPLMDILSECFTILEFDWIRNWIRLNPENDRRILRCSATLHKAPQRYAIFRAAVVLWVQKPRRREFHPMPFSCERCSNIFDAERARRQNALALAAKKM